MSCRLCQCKRQTALRSEICIHFPGIENLTTPTVLAYPVLLMCLHCGFTEFQIEESELRQLAEGTAKSGMDERTVSCSTDGAS